MFEIRKKNTFNKVIKITNKPSEPFLSSSKICLICSQNKADYCCPRCFKSYCSSECYRKHDLNCTEEFYKWHIKGELKLEKLEQEGSSFKEENQSKNSILDEINNSLSEEELQILVEKIRDSNLSSLTDHEKEYLTKMNRIMSHHHHSNNNIWKPYWEDSTNSVNLTIDEINILTSGVGIGNVNIERMYHLYSELKLIRQNLTSPIKATLLDGNPLYYQLIGGLLGYVVMMRSTSGGWKDINFLPKNKNIQTDNNNNNNEKESPLILTEEVDNQEENNIDNDDNDNNNHNDNDNDENFILQSPLSCLELLLQSTPINDVNFRPLSVSQTISEWLQRSSASLPPPSLFDQSLFEDNKKSESRKSRRSKAIQVLLIDVCKILSSRELTLYILLDIWILCFISIEKEIKEIKEIEDERENIDNISQNIIETIGSIACFPPSPQISISSLLIPLIHSSTNKKGESNHRNRIKSNDDRYCIIDRFMKKILYIFNYFLLRSYNQDSLIDSWHERVFLEIKIYIQEFCN